MLKRKRSYNAFFQIYLIGWTSRIFKLRIAFLFYLHLSKNRLDYHRFNHMLHCVVWDIIYGYLWGTEEMVLRQRSIYYYSFLELRRIKMIAVGQMIFFGCGYGLFSYAFGQIFGLDWLLFQHIIQLFAIIIFRIDVLAQRSFLLASFEYLIARLSAIICIRTIECSFFDCTMNGRIVFRERQIPFMFTCLPRVRQTMVPMMTIILSASIAIFLERLNLQYIILFPLGKYDHVIYFI